MTASLPFITFQKALFTDNIRCETTCLLAHAHGKTNVKYNNDMIMI